MAVSDDNGPSDESPKQTATSKPDATASKADGLIPEPSTTPETPSQKPRSLSRSSTTPILPGTTSRMESPRVSREGSPVRANAKSGLPPPRAANRSRKNSQDLSPLRANSTSGPSIPTVPSAAAIQRALSAAGTPQLTPTSQHEVTSDNPRTQKGGKPAPVSAPRTGPNNSRVSSPPPSASSRIGKPKKIVVRKPDQTQSTPSTPSIVVERPQHSASDISNVDTNTVEEDYFSKPGMRTPVRGVSGGGSGLETVQESSLPPTPADSGNKDGSRPSQTNKVGAGERPERIDEDPAEEEFDKDTKPRGDSGNESSGNRSADVRSGGEGKELKKTTTAASKPPAMQAKKSFTQLPLKGKAPADGSVKNMTVETETVSSIPQVAVGGGTGERNLSGRTENPGSVRLKPSNETIRPKKEKKKPARKAPSLHAGTGGCSFKHFHHHHVYSRAASPNSVLSLSITPPGSAAGRWSKHESSPRLMSPDRNGRHLRLSIDSDELSPIKFNSPLKRRRSILTPFRGHPASSKADIFEAKVASAVGEADSSDSEETFVYESNPPEPSSARQHRFHSRTPSTASVASQLDYHKGRQEGHHSLVGKKSMKFANNFSAIANDGDGTVRGPSQSGRSNTPHHHHIGRYGRDARGGHTSLFDNDSPFLNSSKQARVGSGHGSIAPTRSSPKTGHFLKASNSSRKADESSLYDLEGEGADDERTPLVGSVRTGRNRRRPIPGSVRHMYMSKEQSRRYCNRVTGFVALGIALAVLIAAIVLILVMCSKPLVNIHIQDIRNVLASESELMLDLHVHAINPNLVAVQINDLDVNIFAKSKHLSTLNRLEPLGKMSKSFFAPADPKAVAPRSHGRHTESPILSEPEDIISHLLDGGVDEGTDPIDSDPASDSQTMLLGQVFSFDSPLSFDPSPFKHDVVSSTGEVRLARPGNKTEEGGSKRWERVLQHDFELIVRGVLRYSPPVNSMTRSVTVHGSVIVHPNEEADDGTGNMKLTHPKRPEGMDEGSNVIVKRPPPISNT